MDKTSGGLGHDLHTMNSQRSRISGKGRGNRLSTSTGLGMILRSSLLCVSLFHLSYINGLIHNQSSAIIRTKATPRPASTLEIPPPSFQVPQTRTSLPLPPKCTIRLSQDCSLRFNKRMSNGGSQFYSKDKARRTRDRSAPMSLFSSTSSTITSGIEFEFTPSMRATRVSNVYAPQRTTTAGSSTISRNPRDLCCAP